MTDSKILIAKVEKLSSELDHSKRQAELMTNLALTVIEPGDVTHLIRRCMEIVALANDWVMAQYWKPQPDQDIISCSEIFYSSVILTEIRSASTDLRLSKGIGLPGRVWSNAFPVLISDIETETGLSFVRKLPAIKSSIKSAYAFPIKNGPFVIGVMEFLSFESIKMLESTDHRFYEKLGIFIAASIAQREAEAISRRKEIINTVVLDHAYNAFVAITEASLIFEWTRKATELFGWEKDEVMGKPLMDVIIPERYRSAHINGIFRYMTTRRGPVLNKSVQAPALHKDGTEIPIEMKIFPIEALGSKLFGAFIVDLSKKSNDPPIVLT